MTIGAGAPGPESASRPKRRILPQPIRDIFRRLFGRFFGLAGLTAFGQASYLVLLPALSKLYAPSSFGVFVIYLAIANITAPLVTLRFEAALFGATDDREIYPLLVLTIRIAIIMSLLIALIAFMVSESSAWLVFGAAGDAVRLLMPLGIFLVGLVELGTAWAVRNQSVKGVASARLIQPLSLGTGQFLFGFMGFPAEALIAAHIISNILFLAIIAATTLQSGPLQAVRRLPVAQYAALFRANFKYISFTLPAVLISVTTSNLPVMIIGYIFGAGMSGQYGLAYRISNGPVNIICQSIANVFTSEATSGRRQENLTTLVVFSLLSASFLVSGPLLIFGWFAPELSQYFLGQDWLLAGKIVSALCIMGAFQALAMPFSDVTSIYRRQQVRLIQEVLRTLLVFSPLIYGWLADWSPIATIRLMAVGGALGYLFMLVTNLWILHRDGDVFPASSPKLQEEI